MFNDVEKLEREILALEGKLEHAREKRKELDAIDPEQRLAIMLHKKFCHLNHTDHCGWDYENGDTRWGGYAHAEYLKHAKEILAAMER